MPVDGGRRDVSEINAHRDVRQRGQSKFKRIGKHHFARRNDNGGSTTKCKSLVRNGVDVAIARAARAGGQGDVRGVDRDRVSSVGVGESCSQKFSTKSRVDELAKRAVGQGSGWQISGLGQLRSAPR